MLGFLIFSLSFFLYLQPYLLNNGILISSWDILDVRMEGEFS